MSSNFLTSLLYGFSFGIGVVIVPFLLFYFFIFNITSGILLELKNYKKHIEIFSASLLILVGVLVFLERLKL
jgi:cytochrome c biogenesis protein CcdA